MNGLEGKGLSQLHEELLKQNIGYAGEFTPHNSSRPFHFNLQM